MRRRRIAFLSDEFPSESPDAGGLASYLDRISRALLELGHEVEVLTRSYDEPRVLDWDGVRVESVRPLGLGESGWRRLLARLGWRPLPAELRGRLQTALALGRAFERRHAERGFELVQSANCSLCGLFVKRRPGLRHLVRMSSARLPWLRADGREPDLADRIVAGLERLQARRADAVYAPSRYLAEQLRRDWGVEVGVIRPPAPAEAKSAVPPARLPERFLLHFGALRRRKGTELLAQALLRAWQREPHLELVLAGRESPPELLAPWRERWGRYRRNVRQLGPLERRELPPLIARALACVVPSLVDNLPNSAIESLALGVPVIASDGASLDELVQPGRNGELVPLGDPDALADALVRAWRGDAPWLGAGFARPACLTAMAPGPAAGALLHFAFGIPAP